MNPDILNEIAAEVKRIALAESPQRLGFGAKRKHTKHVHCNLKHGGVWHFMDEANNPIVIEHEALTGYVRALEFKPAIDQGEKVFNLSCTLEADEFYVLESESTSHFSKALLSAIAKLKSSELQQPLTLVPQVISLIEEVLTCQVYQGDRLVYAPYDQTMDWKGVSREAVNSVKLVNGEKSSRALPI
jgi:hypothetical protein